MSTLSPFATSNSTGQAPQLPNLPSGDDVGLGGGSGGSSSPSTLVIALITVAVVLLMLLVILRRFSFVQRGFALLSRPFKKLLSPVLTMYSAIQKRRASDGADPPRYDNTSELPRYVESERRLSTYGWSEAPPPYLPGARSDETQIVTPAPRVPPPAYPASHR